MNGFPFDAALFSATSGYQLIRIRDLDASHTSMRYGGAWVGSASVHPGEVLIGMDGEFNIGTWRGSEPALLNQRMCCVRTADSSVARYLLYALPFELKAINETAWATTVKHLSSREVGRIRVPIPPSGELPLVLRFLDHADGRIRRVISAKRKLIALLNEQKQAVIHRAVTRGLDPNVELKPSGVEWLGDVPQHWDVVLNQRIFKEQIRPHRGLPETQLSLSQRDGLIASRDMRERSLQTSTYDNWKVAVPGDLVLNRFKAHLGVFFASTLRGIVSFHYGVFAAGRPLLTKYFELLYHTNEYKAIYAGRSNGMTVGLQNLSNQSFYNVRSIVPPYDEQVEIVAFAEKATAHLKHALAAADRQITLLREYRTRLIADVVSGTLDVREAAARLPDEVDDAEPFNDADVDETAEDVEGLEPVEG